MSRWFACVSHFCGTYILSSATKTQSLIYAPLGSAIKTMTPLMGDIGVDQKIRKMADIADQISKKPKTWQIFYIPRTNWEHLTTSVCG